jgi:Flp pilus assembly protein TadG
MIRVVVLVRRFRRRPGGDPGQVTPFVVILVVALIALAGLVLDAGLALSAKVQALDAAQAAARTGAQELDLATYRITGKARLNPVSATNAAQAWLAAGCLDGTASATTTDVTVTVYRTTQTQLLQLIGISTLNVSATATATAVQGSHRPQHLNR